MNAQQESTSQLEALVKAMAILEQALARSETYLKHARTALEVAKANTIESKGF